MRKLAVLSSAIVVCGGFATVAMAQGAGPSFRHRSDCINVNTEKITGIEVVTSGGLACPGARRTMKKYFRLVVETGQTVGGCAQVRSSKGCRVGEFRCFTVYRYGTGGLHGV